MLPYFTTWIENLAKDWVRKGLSRFPVEGVANVGWSKTGVLRSGSVDAQVTMACKFTRQIQTHTIQFDGPNNDIESGAARTLRPQARITWMVNGVGIVRVIDVIDGTSISGQAESVDVIVSDATFGGVGTEYRVGIIVTPGVRANFETPPTLRMDGALTSAPNNELPPDNVAIPNGDTMNWEIPPNVGAVGYMVNAFNAGVDLTDDDIFIEITSVDGNVFSITGFSSCFKWLPLPASAKFISLHNNSGSALQGSAILAIQG